MFTILPFNLWKIFMTIAMRVIYNHLQGENCHLMPAKNIQVLHGALPNPIFSR